MKAIIKGIKSTKESFAKVLLEGGEIEADYIQIVDDKPEEKPAIKDWDFGADNIEKARKKIEELNTLVITVWKDGTHRIGTLLDSSYYAQDLDWWFNIPIKDILPLWGIDTQLSFVDYVLALLSKPAKPEAVDKTRIGCAAVRTPDGTIWEGRYHGEIIRKIAEKHKLYIDQDMQGFTVIADTPNGSTKGFVNRREALEIAEKAGQIFIKHNPKDELLSEDLKENAVYLLERLQTELAEKDKEIERLKERNAVSLDTQKVHDGILKQALKAGVDISKLLSEIASLKEQLAELGQKFAVMMADIDKLLDERDKLIEKNKGLQKRLEANK
jgi:FtsZ-binding cell division protein ZapB